MPKTSGYPKAKDLILTHIAEKQPKELDRATVAAMLELSISTAGNYLMLLANEFPENLTYVRGILIIKSAFPQGRLPPEVRLQSKEKQIEEARKLAEKIEKNHLSHRSPKKLKEALRELRQRLDKI